MRPNNVYLTAICRNHMGTITHAWIKVEVHGDSLWAEAKASLFAVSCALDERISATCHDLISRKSRRFT